MLIGLVGAILVIRMFKISTKRAYEKPSKSDGYRILVDRLWPRGVSKDDAQIDYWAKDIAPSNDLRVWFGHKPELFKEFSNKYIDELKHNPTAEDFLKIIKDKPKITLIYGAKDTNINQAQVLLKYLNAIL